MPLYDAKRAEVAVTIPMLTITCGTMSWCVLAATLPAADIDYRKTRHAGNDPGDLPLPASSRACVASQCPPPAVAARRGCGFEFGEVRRGVDDRGMGEGLREIP